LDGIPGYEENADQQFSEYMGKYPFNGNKIRFPSERKLALADLSDPTLGCFGQDAVVRSSGAAWHRISNQ
jgi:hypothetical protein